MQESILQRFTVTVPTNPESDWLNDTVYPQYAVSKIGQTRGKENLIHTQILNTKDICTFTLDLGYCLNITAQSH